jgi:gliding motility-associated lipoprotein GldH
MHLKKTISLFVLSALLVSCGPKVVYQKEYLIKNENWLYNDTLNFDFEIADTNKLYDIWFDIQHKENFAFQNIYLNIFTLLTQEKRAKQLLSIELCDPAGKWFGKKSDKSVNYQLKIQENAFFDKIGKYQITLEQFMRTDTIRGIQKIGIRIEETDQIIKDKPKNKKNK